jgi:hypothetical protein
MKVRQAYEGRVIEARSSELKNSGWDSEFSIEEHETTGVTETAFYVPGVFPLAEVAIQAAVTSGQQEIDSGFEYKPVVRKIGNSKREACIPRCAKISEMPDPRRWFLRVAEEGQGKTARDNSRRGSLGFWRMTGTG